MTVWPVDSEERIEVTQDATVAEPKIGALIRRRSSRRPGPEAAKLRVEHDRE